MAGILSVARSRFLTTSIGIPTMAAVEPNVAAIEVERKFQPEDPDSLKRKVLENGGSVVGEKRFVDVYWDSAGCVLTRRDTWLRQRGDGWELKVPIGDPADRRGASGGERTVFREIEGAEAVAAALEPLLPVKAEGPLASLLTANELAPFAEFETVRARYTLGGCSLDADVASFGHAVLEIERMAESESEVSQAEAEIERVAALLGATPLGGTGGKLETFIRTKRPDVLRQLVEAGVLKP